MDKFIEAIGEHTLQPLHPQARIALGSLHTEVVVVAHQNISMDSPAKALTGLEQGLLESLS